MNAKKPAAPVRRPYTVTFTPLATGELEPLSPKVQRQVLRKIEALADNPRPPKSKQLEGYPNLHRVRSGDYRVLYVIRDEDRTVLVARVGLRGNVYKGLPPRGV